MKMELITLQAVKNYGSVLQALATQELFMSHGLDVSIINYQKKESRFENLLKLWAGKNPIKALVILPSLLRWRKVFDGFCKEYLNISGKIYTTDQDFESYPINSDLYCTGSDQVWNSKWNNGILAPLYLSFVPQDKFKFSFAASFGQERLSQNEVDETKRYIDQYKYISVREDSAKRIVQEQYGYSEVTHIIDPTLCVDGDFWRSYITKRPVKKGYILIYNLNRSKGFDNYAKKLAQRTGLELVRLCTRYDQMLRPGKSVLVPEVFEFVRLIDQAEYVLTDSFHATAFSMNMNTEPICIYPMEFGGRLDSFLKLLECTHRHVRDFDDLDVVNRRVDFEKVNRILDCERKKASNYIAQVINAAEEYYQVTKE